MQPILQVSNVGKHYRLRASPIAPTLREVLMSPLRRPQPNGQSKPVSDLWALQSVTFSARPGEVIGILGRNGAGKSTLLKILSRVIKPSNGEVNLFGRVGGLLSLGTGFHPDLTGKENVYLNGAILGMRRAEIQRKFDEIVAFAEIERFLETPVKYYSSGMYLRLAFSVAAHFEPEILLLDEVLAVGDASFQKKCIERMKQVSGEGRTVLYVSHDVMSVQHLCGRALLIESGRLMEDGPPDKVSASYLKILNTTD